LAAVSGVNEIMKRIIMQEMYLIYS
jgi:hypothetical protein